MSEANKFNSNYPVGTKVRYYPYTGCDLADCTESKTRTEAWELGNGDAVVSIEGKSGGMSLDNIQVID